MQGREYGGDGDHVVKRGPGTPIATPTSFERMEVRLETIEVRRLGRRLLEDCLEDVLRIELAVQAELGEIYSHETWGAEHFLADRPEKWELSFGAFAGAGLVGFLIASRNGDDVHLHRLATDPATRRRASALALLLEVERAAMGKGLGRVTLSVTTANARAIRLYRGLGYRPLAGVDLEAYASRHGVAPAGDHVIADGRSYLILARTPGS